jgi:hypothetical protein
VHAYVRVHWWFRLCNVLSVAKPRASCLMELRQSLHSGRQDGGMTKRLPGDVTMMPSLRDKSRSQTDHHANAGRQWNRWFDSGANMPELFFGWSVVHLKKLNDIDPSLVSIHKTYPCTVHVHCQCERKTFRTDLICWRLQPVKNANCVKKVKKIKVTYFLTAIN